MTFFNANLTVSLRTVLPQGRVLQIALFPRLTVLWLLALYCKWSKNGSGDGLGTRRASSWPTLLEVWYSKILWASIWFLAWVGNKVSSWLYRLFWRESDHFYHMVLSQFSFPLKTLIFFFCCTHSYLYGKFMGGHSRKEGRGAREEGTGEGREGTRRGGKNTKR